MGKSSTDLYHLFCNSTCWKIVHILLYELSLFAFRPKSKSSLLYLQREDKQSLEHQRFTLTASYVLLTAVAQAIQDVQISLLYPENNSKLSFESLKFTQTASIELGICVVLYLILCLILSQTLQKMIVLDLRVRSLLEQIPLNYIASLAALLC